jgi:hypothetical protein
MTTFNWIIPQLDSLSADGFVVRVHYRVEATDGAYSAAIFNTISYTQTEGATYIPYTDLTKDIVVGWVQERLGKDNVESSLQSQIDARKAPVQTSGLPW